MKKTVVVNATSINASGTLTILYQFLSHVCCFSEGFEYLIFVSPLVDFGEYVNVKFIPIYTSRRFGRIIWDEFSFRKHIKSMGVSPDLIISFQNTGVRFSKDIPQIWYFQQALCVEERQWNIFTNTDLFYYRNILPLFIKMHLRKNTFIVTQIPSVRQKFIRRFTLDPKNVLVITPDMDFADTIEIPKIDMDRHFAHFIFPATFYPYKNHMEIVNALSYMKSSYPSLLGSIKVHFTLDPIQAKTLVDTIREKGLSDNFVFEGKMEYGYLLSMYKYAHGLLFPSYMESFGLPLIEAAFFGCPVISADKQYAHDVLHDYEGVRYVQLDNPISWCKSILELASGKQRYVAYKREKSDWRLFFELVEKLCQ